MAECVKQKENPLKAGFVKMGDRKLVEQPMVILPVILLTNKDRGPHRLIRRKDHISDLFNQQRPGFSILNKSPDPGGRA